MEPARVSTSTAPISRTGQWLVLEITPPRWPLAVALVLLVSSLVGAYGAVSWAPVGNRATLHVVPKETSPMHTAAAAAFHAELQKELRALRLDVGGPDDGVRPSMHLTVTVDAQPHPGAALASVVTALVVAEVVDDTAGGEAQVSFVGFGPTPARAAASAGTGVAWLAAGEIAALVAPQKGRESTLRRVTDGRGALRVFARTRGELVFGRQERLEDMAAAREPQQPSVALGVPGEHTHLMAAVNHTQAVVAVEERVAYLPAGGRRTPRVLSGIQSLQVRGAGAPVHLMDAMAFLGRGAASANGQTVGVVAMDGDEQTAACLVELEGARRRCKPLGDVTMADVLAVDAKGNQLVARVARCTSGCSWELLWWNADTQATTVLPAVEDPRNVTVDGAGVRFVDGRSTWRWSGMSPSRVGPAPDAPARNTQVLALPGGARLTVGPDPNGVMRTVVSLEDGRGASTTVLAAAADQAHAAVSPDGTTVFVELEQPDPDANATWSEVRRVNLP